MTTRSLSFAVAGVAALVLSLPLCGHGQSTNNVMHIDATAPVPAPEPVAATLGSSRSPAGHVLSANSQYLTMDGKPWLPVMGEFHFSRYPESRWEQEILKMKAAGVNVIATYIIWLHHEQTRGAWNWTGQRDLRRFVDLCARHGMYVYPRIGPWAHGEARNGGFPDWVVEQGNTRENDPKYLASVTELYKQIGAQLKGEMWKDGGPVIGIQIENEYRARGAGKGSEHIRTLKKIAIDAGLDSPLYTVTGWDGTAIPLDSVLPVFGGYPDAPWDGSDKKLPPNEVYAFRFNNRSAGSMGAIGGRGQSAASTYQGTPFLTAEVGDGIQDTYFRRPVVSADDVAAIVPVILGSGANMLGYYMFHGGRNPNGGAITLQESQRTGYPTDVPVKSYDFQAPLGEFGQESASLRKLKLVHYFLHDFGASLATMTPRAPDRIPSSPADASVPRIAARMNGEQGYVFVSNYVRNLNMPARTGFQVRLATPSGTIAIPQQPMTLPANSYGIWPVNLPLGAKSTLRYSTAQLVKRVESHGQTYFFFFALPGVPAEFLLDGSTVVSPVSSTVTTLPTAEGQVLVRTQSDEAHIALSGGIHLVLMSEANAEDLWRTDDPAVLLQSPAFAMVDGATWTFLAIGTPKLRFGVFGGQPAAESTLTVLPEDSLGFHRYTEAFAPVALKASVTRVAAATPRAPWELGPAVSWRKTRVPFAPEDRDFEGAERWKLTLPPLPASLSDAFLRVQYQGDVARLYRGATLIDDSFWNGVPWTVGMREIEEERGGSLELRVLPLPESFPMYIEDAGRLVFHHGTAVALDSVHVIPQYKFVVRSAAPDAAESAR